MQNTIEIIECENRLHLAKEYRPIICGNTNYKIKFEFSESWQACNKKTAFFVVEGKKIPIEFEGDICNIPAMPNLGSFLVFLVASSDENEILSSTPIRLNLEKNPSMDKLKKTEPFKSYYAALLGAIDKVESGNIVAFRSKTAETADFAKNAEMAQIAVNATNAENATYAQNCANAQNCTTAQNAINAEYSTNAVNANNAVNAENATNSTLAERALVADSATIAQKSNTQVSLTGDEDIAGIKNFTDDIRKKGKTLLSSKEVSNPNLLINGNFKINQRGKTTYNIVGQYTVDRWKLVSGSVSVVDNGIRLNGTISQVFEKPIQGEIVASVDSSNGMVDVGCSSSGVNITATDVIISWVKLERGNIATKFIPKSETEELNDCYRYYFKNGSSTNKWFLYGSASTNFSTSASCLIYLPVEMRTTPTLTYTGNFRFIASGDKGYSISKMTVGHIGSNTISLSLTGSGFSGTGFLNGNDSVGYLMFDAEIY